MTSAEQAKDKRLQKTYKITLDQWNILLAKQNYECAICGRPFPPRKNEDGKSFIPQQDHLHSCCPRKLKEFCGKCNRGALCMVCNKFVMGIIERMKIPTYELDAYVNRWEKELRAKGCYDKPKEEKKARKLRGKKTSLRRGSKVVS